uniref:Uncharacterized protein n=1 Tax=Globisporangium ultimum (strain ATCC 200006 / CBS 805.95 / DAOM BR144) TaxID=431595 RepID=K3X380_GLOUD
MEIMVSEQLGHITVRDDYDNIEKSVCTYRLVSNYNSIRTESNDAMFTKYFENHELTNGEPCGVVTVDFVDEDTLYPRIPSERIRKDVSLAIELTPHLRPRAHEGENDELVVVMSYAKFVKLHCAFNATQNVGDGAVDWADVMVNAIKEILRSGALRG